MNSSRIASSKYSDRSAQHSSVSSLVSGVNEEIKYYNPYVSSRVFQRSSSVLEKNNPYSQSLWYYSRGNSGEEIRLKEINEKHTLRPIYKVAAPSKHPVDIAQIQRLVEDSVRALHLLKILEESLDSYIKKNAIVFSAEQHALLFGNLETLLVINEMFVERICAGDGCSLNDFLARATQIYPSFMNHTVQRRELASMMDSNATFGGWIGSISNLLLMSKVGTFVEAVEQPATCMEALVAYMRAIEVDDKTKGLLMRLSSDARPQPDVAAVYSFAIPESWKAANKHRWREIARETVEVQSLVYLEDKIRSANAQHTKFISAISSATKVLSDFAKAATEIASTFQGYDGIPCYQVSVGTADDPLTPRTELFFENSVKSTYQLYKDKTNKQYSEMARLISHFEYCAVPRQQQLSDLCRAFLHQMKRFQRSKERDVATTQAALFQAAEFADLFQQVSELMLAKCIILLRRCIHIGREAPEAPNSSSEAIVEQFHRSKERFRRELANRQMDATEFASQLATARILRRMY